MTKGQPDLKIRQATHSDIDELCALINEIIEIGGTTANETPFTYETFKAKVFDGEERLSCLVAIDEANTIAGYQTLAYNSKLPEDWGDIATFARVTPKIKGVGSALFDATSQFALENGIPVINATIRADNTGGLKFYEKMGFQTYSVDEAVPLKDGTEVDRIRKKFEITKT